jgi:hypothetical protein
MAIYRKSHTVASRGVNIETTDQNLKGHMHDGCTAMSRTEDHLVLRLSLDGLGVNHKPEWFLCLDFRPWNSRSVLYEGGAFSSSLDHTYLVCLRMAGAKSFWRTPLPMTGLSFGRSVFSLPIGIPKPC